MTPRAREILQWLVDLESIPDEEGYEAEIVCDGLSCWIGAQRVHRSTVTQLLRLIALHDVSDVKGAQRYEINETGRALLRRPELESEITAAVLAGRGSWMLRDDRLVLMEDRP